MEVQTDRFRSVFKHASETWVEAIVLAERVFDELATAVLNYDAEKAIESTRRALQSGTNPVDIIEKGLAKGLKIIGDKFGAGELFLVDLAVAADTVNRVMREVLEPELVRQKVDRWGAGRVVIGTVTGDIHDLGKNLVVAMLTAAGFSVYDLGKDVPVQKFVEKAKEVGADIVASSALLSTTMPIQRKIIEALEAAGLRDKVKVMVGGAPVTEEWAKEIGADGYGADAVEATRVAKKLLA